jgi:hypothetical protein
MIKMSVIIYMIKFISALYVMQYSLSSDFVNVYATKLDNDLYVSHYTIKTQWPVRRWLCDQVCQRFFFRNSVLTNQ